MSFKDDPLRGSSKFAKRTLWLDREGMHEANENFWQAFKAQDPATLDERTDRRTWDIAFAASIAAFSFLMEGRLEPGQ